MRKLGPFGFCSAKVATMAFKPMHFFRKRQKTILALITIGTMFLFVLGDAIMGARGGYGGGGRRGGLINKVKEWFGSGHEEAVATVNGQAFDPEKLTEIYHTRLLGAALVDRVFQTGEALYMQSLGFSNDDDQAKRDAKMREVMAKNPHFQEEMIGRMSTLSFQAYPTLGLRAPAVYSISRDPEQLAALIRQASRFQISLFNLQLFNIPPDPESMIEFEYWKRKADNLGISISSSFVKDDLISLGLKKLTEQDLTTISRSLAQEMRLRASPPKLDELLTVIGDEIRVHLAKQILEETSASLFGASNSPQLTPLDLWNSYVNVKTSLNVGILPLKTEDYISKVANPTNEEIQAFYDKYKKEYPDPERDTPGFKIPPMYRIGFIYADMKETQPARKYYDQWVDAIDYLSPYTALGELMNDYNVKKDITYRVTQPFLEFTMSKKPTEGPWYRINKPYTLSDQAGVAGFVANIAATFLQTNSLPPFDLSGMSFRGEAVRQPQVDAAAAASLVGQFAGGWQAVVPNISNSYEGHTDVYRPFDSVAAALMNQRHEEQAKRLLGRDLDQLSNDLVEYGKRYSEWRGKMLRKTATSNQPPLYKDTDKEKQTLSDYLTKFAAQRGLAYHETKDIRSRVDLLNEPGERLLNTFIAPLYINEQFKNEKKRDFEERVKSRLVGNELRGDKPKLFTAMNTDVDSTKPHQLQIALHWITEASDPRTPDLKDCQAQVVTAWKMEKARDVVQEEAKKLIKDVQSAPDNERKLIDMKGYVVGQTIARYREPALRALAIGTSYETCPAPEMLEYEPNDLVKQCLDQLHKKADMTLIANRPKNIYYLFYLRDRSEPKITNPIDVEAFHTEIIRPSSARSFTVDNQAFRTFALAEKNQVGSTEWLKYLKALTSFKEDEAKRFADMASKDRW
jgi:hypothetical protein